jgi:hypothetical protein
LCVSNARMIQNNHRLSPQYAERHHVSSCLPLVLRSRLSRSLTTFFCTTENSSPKPQASTNAAPNWLRVSMGGG